MQIWLLRHAQAENTASSGRDEDRHLNAAGQASCRGLQGWIRDYGGSLPAQVLVSPARRALETAQTTLDRLELPPMTMTSALWNARAGDLAELIQQNACRPEPLMLIGHNPGLENLVLWLCGGIPMPGLKPGALVIIDLDPPLRPGCGRITQFIQPSESM